MKKILLTSLRIGIFAACILLMLDYFQKHQQELDAIWQINLSLLGPMGFLALLVHTLSAEKQFVILKSMGLTNCPRMAWLDMFSIARFFTFHVMQGGNIYRTWRLRRDYDFSMVDSLGLIGLIVWFDLLFVLLFALIILLASGASLVFEGLNIAWILLAGFITLMLLPWIARFFHARQYAARWFKILQQPATALHHSSRNKGLIINQFLLAASIFAVYVVQLSLAFSAFGLSFGWAEIALFTALTMLMGVINITPGNIGLRELAFGLLAEIFGASLGQGILASGLARVIAYLAVLIMIAFTRFMHFRRCQNA